MKSDSSRNACTGSFDSRAALLPHPGGLDAQIAASGHQLSLNTSDRLFLGVPSCSRACTYVRTPAWHHSQLTASVHTPCAAMHSPGIMRAHPRSRTNAPHATCRAAGSRFSTIWRRQHQHKQRQRTGGRQPEPTPPVTPPTTDGAAPADAPDGDVASHNAHAFTGNANTGDAQHAGGEHSHTQHHRPPHLAPQHAAPALQNSPVSGVPVFVMLPLDTIGIEFRPEGTSRSVVQNVEDLQKSLRDLKAAGVTVCTSRGLLAFCVVTVAAH